MLIDCQFFLSLASFHLSVLLCDNISTFLFPGSGSHLRSTPLLEYIKKKKEEKRATMLKAREDRRKREIERRKQKEEERRKRKEKERQREKEREKRKEDAEKKDEGFKENFKVCFFFI